MQIILNIFSNNKVYCHYWKVNVGRSKVKKTYSKMRNFTTCITNLGALISNKYMYKKLRIHAKKPCDFLQVEFIEGVKFS